MGLPVLVRSLRICDFTYNPSQSTINCGKADFQGPVTHVLQSRVTSSGTTVDALFVPFVLLFAFVVFLFFGNERMGVEALIRRNTGVSRGSWAL